MADKSTVRRKSPAEFFAENKNIAGFDNAGKCLFTSVRELVENSLDSAESISELPDVEIGIEEVSQKALNRVRGVENHERIDEALYQDFETENERKKRLAKEARDQERLAKLVANKGMDAMEVEAKRKEIEAKKLAQASKQRTYYKLTVKDNGAGMPHQDIPSLLGVVLSGTKYQVKQTRGKFGLGAKMVLIWSKMTTGLPFEIWSAQKNQKKKSHYLLDIDIHRNEPNVHKVELVDNAVGWHGVDVSVTIEGDWNKCRAKVLNYLRQIAVITPYAKFTFTYLSLAGKGNVSKVYRRRTDVMPRLPKEMKYHPSSVDLELIKNLIAHTKQTTVEAFLHKDFDCIDKEYARRLIEEMRGGVDPDTSPQELTNKHIIRIHQILHQARFPDPTGAHLSPAGEYNIRLGVMKEIQPDLVATYQGDVRVFEGHAFIVEAAVSCGGNINPGINIHRYANRIPLLFEAGADVITRTALKRINWKSYKINQTGDKVGVFVSIVSTKIPFKGVGKEHIGDDIEEMVHAVKQALQHCCIQLKGKITRAIAISEQSHRKRNLAKYIPDAINSIYSVLESMADHKPYGPKRQRLEEKHNLPQEIKNRAVTKEAMLKKLTEHVERIDTDMAPPAGNAQDYWTVIEDKIALGGTQMKVNKSFNGGPNFT